MRKITLPVSNPKKTLSGDLLKNAIPKPLPAGTTRPSAIKAVAGGLEGASTRGIGAIPAGAETDAGTNGESSKLNPTQQRDAAVVAKLPSGFPIQNWDSMSPKAQLQAMKFSGLTEQEQWQLLNPSAPLRVLDAANRERYRPVTTTGADKDLEILTNPSKTPYLQNGESDGQLGKGKGIAGGAAPKKKVGRVGTLMSISKYPAIAQLVDIDHITPKQGAVLAKSQIKLTALGMKGEPTQQEIDDILADACTKMLTDENRPKTDNNDPQEKIPANTDAINQYLHRKRVQAEEAAESIQMPYMLSNADFAPDVSGFYQWTLLDFLFGNFPEGKYDLRHMSSWQAEITDYSPSVPPFSGSRFLFVYDGDLLSVEDLGNAMYGFYGTALGFSVDDLYKGAGLASRVSNAFDDDPKSIPDRNNGYLGDDADDRAAIDMGINWYLEGKGK